MILPDVNVLVYAFRQDMPRHESAKRWLDRVVSGDSQFGLSPVVLSGVIRVATHPRIFQQPSDLSEAFAFCSNLLSQPHCILVQPGERHWPIFQRLCRDVNTLGSRVSDTWFAALAIEAGCTWVTYDRHFARYPGLIWQEPER